MDRRRLFVGLAVVAAYVIAVSVTVALRDGHVRPLYDGFAPPSSYRFVDPPAFFAPDNIQPTARSATVRLGAAGSEAAGIATPDGQFVINLARGAIATAPGASTVLARITPLSARGLVVLPDRLRATGNAYHLELTYQPSGEPVTRLAKAGTLVVETPENGQSLFLSSDARTWSSLATHVIPPRQLTMTATLNAPGYYVAATSQPTLTALPEKASHAALLIGLGTTALAASMFLATYLVVRKRRAARTHRSRSRRPGKTTLRVKNAKKH